MNGFWLSVRLLGSESWSEGGFWMKRDRSGALSVLCLASKGLDLVII